MVFTAIEMLPKDLWPVSLTVVTMHLWEKCAYKTRIFWRNWGKQRQNKPWETTPFSFCKRTDVICFLNRDQTGAGSDRVSYPTGIGMRSPFLWDATQRKLAVSCRRFGTTLLLYLLHGKCVKKIQFVCSHKTQLSAKLSLFLSYDMFRPTITAIVRLYTKPLTHMP